MTLVAINEFTSHGAKQAAAEAWQPITVPFQRFSARGSADSECRFSVNIAPEPDRLAGRGEPARAPSPLPPGECTAQQEIAAVASFLIDATHKIVPLVTTARMIGCFYLARIAAGVPGSVTILLSGSEGSWAMARVNQHRFEIEQTRFGAAHVLHEDNTLGLYILEIAPGREIPAHAHKVMRETEMILEDGLLLQGEPVTAGLAFNWPLEYVHA